MWVERRADLVGEGNERALKLQCLQGFGDERSWQPTAGTGGNTYM
jgi:hypothetical protein